MKEILVVGVLLMSGLFISPQAVFADVIQNDVSTSTIWVAPGVRYYQTLGTGLSGTVSSIDISYLAITTYYGVKVTPRIEECSSGNYGDCTTISEPVITPEYGPQNGVKSIDLVDYPLNHCKYYRISLIAVGPFGSMGSLYYHGSLTDTYIGGSYSGGDISDIYFVLHGADRPDRSANTAENLCVDPVIIVPGLLGSFEKNGVLLMDPILHAYDDLIATFEANGYVDGSTLFPFPYNWRNSNVDTAILLKQKIDEVKAICNCSKVDIIAHSMGGLVTRQYVQSDTYGNDVDQVIFLATPHLGSPKAYLAWEGGAFPVPSVSDAVAYAILRSEAKHSDFADVFDYIQNRPVSSIKELLPIYDYLTIVDTNTGVTSQPHYPTGHPTNTFLSSLNSTVGRLSRVRYKNIVGNTGTTTIGNLRVSTSSSPTRWQHGQPQNLILGSALELVTGDKTVPTSSSGGLSSNDFVIAEHTNVPDIAIENAYSILTGDNVETLIREENNPDYVFLAIVILSPIDALVIAPDGKKVGYTSAGEINEIPGAFYSGNNTENEFIVIPAPLDGEYKVETTGTGDGEYTVAASSISEDSVVDTEYTGTTLVGNISKLVLDVDTSSPSPTLAIAPEPPPVIAETLSVSTSPPVVRSGGGGGRRSTQQGVMNTVPVTAVNNPTTVNPNTVMITMDIPIERFISLMTNSPVETINRPSKTPIRKLQNTIGISPTQTASVINAVDNQPVKSVFTDKIKSVFTTMFNWFKK